MALTDGNESGGMVMPVSPMYGGGNGFGFGGDWAWIILLLLLGWGNNGWGNGGGFGGDGIYPWMNQANLTSNGFQNQLMNDNVTSIRDGVFGISTQLCNGFAGVNAGVANGFAQAEISNNARAMADMNRSFALQSQLADCCCENRLATADLKYTVATENCADRYEAAQNTRDIMENCNRNNQAILDKLCALELDAKNDKIADLERQLSAANLAASQIAQNGAITDSVYARLKDCPIGTMPIYGNTPIFTCGGNSGCGCGGNGIF